MPKIWVKNNGAWKQVQRLWVKQAGTWVSPTTGSILDVGIGKQFYPDATPASIYSIAGNYQYVVPSGVTSVILRYPTITGMTEQTVSVTPGTTIPITCGDYGVNSSFGATIIPTYSKTVFNHSGGNIDNTLTQIFTVATTNVASASTSGTTQGGSSANLNVNGIFFATLGEGNQGDFQEDIQISTVPISTLVGTFRAIGQITSSRGESSVNMEQQPSGANSWRARFTVTEFGYSNYPVTFRINIEQQGYITVIPLNSNIITYSTPGTYTFTVPAGITSLNTTIIGGGGGSGGNYQSNNTVYNGTAGGAGTKLVGSLPVTPGQTYTIVVGGGGTFGTSSVYGGANGTGGTGNVAGAAGVSSGNGGGGGGGGSSAILLSGTPLIQAKGGNGGANSVGGAAGTGGGTNVIPSGFTSSTGTNGGPGGNLTLVYSGSYSNGSGTSQLSAIRNTLISTYPYLYSSIGAIAGSSPDFNFPITLTAGVNLVAQGAQQGFRTYPAYSTAYTTLNGGAFAVGNTVSGINFATGNTQGNGGQSFWFWSGDTWSSGSSGQVVISYGYTA